MAVLAVIAAGASPIPGGTEEPRRLLGDGLDTNNDGFISFEEFVGGLAGETVKSEDANHDLFLSREEVREPEGHEPDRDSASLSFDEIDTNHDGKIDAEEIERAAAKDRGVRLLFDTLDKNHDEKLSRQEQRSAPGLGVLRVEW